MLPLELRGDADARGAGARDPREGRPRRAPRATTRASCPAASSSASRWRAPSSPGRRCCSPTSPPATSTPTPARRSSTCCSTLNADAGTTLVLVTHDEHLAARCGRMLRLDSGAPGADDEASLRAGLAPAAPRPRRRRRPHPARGAGAGGGGGDGGRLRHRPRRARAGASRPTACSAATRWCAAMRRSPARVRDAANAPRPAAAPRRIELRQHDPRRRGEQLQLGDLRALGAGFPLRGSFRIVDAIGGPNAMPTRHPRARHGVDEPRRRRHARAHGRRRDRASAMRSCGSPRWWCRSPTRRSTTSTSRRKVFLNLADLPATGLVQEGSRIALPPGRRRRRRRGRALRRARARRSSAAGSAWKRSSDARPEIRSALDRAGRFLGLAALVSVVLAAVAVAMAARRHSARHLSGTAVMRCLGASQRTLVGIHVGELLLLGLIAQRAWASRSPSALQWAVGGWLAHALAMSIPPAGWLPALQGYGVGLVVLLAFGAPPVLALRRVPALRVLRRDLDPTEPSAWLVGDRRLRGPRRAAVVEGRLGRRSAPRCWSASRATLAVLALLAWLLILRRAPPALAPARQPALRPGQRRAAAPAPASRRCRRWASG